MGQTMASMRAISPVEVDVHTLHNPTCTYNNNNNNNLVVANYC